RGDSAAARRARIMRRVRVVDRRSAIDHRPSTIETLDSRLSPIAYRLNVPDLARLAADGRLLRLRARGGRGAEAAHDDHQGFLSGGPGAACRGVRPDGHRGQPRRTGN